MICADFLAGAALEAGGSEQNVGRSAAPGYSRAISGQLSTTDSR
jgi:hypothetical protein